MEEYKEHKNEGYSYTQANIKRIMSCGLKVNIKKYIYINMLFFFFHKNNQEPAITYLDFCFFFFSALVIIENF